MKKSSIRKTWNVISSILVALVVLLALLLVGARLFGLQVYTVLSGSMEPTYHTGSLIYVKKVDPYTIRDGQVITFMLDENTIATHRVVGVVPDEEDSTVVRFRTKGDANETEDGGLVHYKNVIGTPVFTIPYLGFVANYIQHPPRHVCGHLGRSRAPDADVPAGHLRPGQQGRDRRGGRKKTGQSRRGPSRPQKMRATPQGSL